MKLKKINYVVIFIMILFVSMNVCAATCEEVFKGDLLNILKEDVYRPIKIIAPILLLVFTTIDFAKAVFNGDDKDGLNKAKSNFLKRAIATLIVFFIPDILTIIMNLVNTYNMDSCLNSIGK